MTSRSERLLATFTSPEVVTFLAVGGVGYAVDVASFNVLLSASFLGSADPSYARIVAVALAMVVTYLGNRLFTWRGQTGRDQRREIGLFIIFNIIGLGFSVATLIISHDLLGLTSRLADNISANVVGLALGTLFRFWSYKKFVFGSSAPVTPAKSSLPVLAQRPHGHAGAGPALQEHAGRLQGSSPGPRGGRAVGVVQQDRATWQRGARDRGNDRRGSRVPRPVHSPRRPQNRLQTCLPRGVPPLEGHHAVGRAVPADLRTTDVLDDLATAHQGPVEAPGCAQRQAVVLPPVHGQLVTGGRHLPDESGLALGMCCEQEERSRHPPGSEQVQEERCRTAVRAVVEGQCDVTASAHASQPREQRAT